MIDLKKKDKKEFTQYALRSSKYNLLNTINEELEKGNKFVKEITIDQYRSEFIIIFEMKQPDIMPAKFPNLETFSEEYKRNTIHPKFPNWDDY